VCDHTGWWANLAHHRFNPGEPSSWWAGQKLIRTDIFKNISNQTQPKPVMGRIGQQVLTNVMPNAIVIL